MAIDSGQSPKKRASDLLKNADKLLKAGQHKEALQDVEQALALDPRNAFALAYQQRIKSLLDQAPKTAGTAAAPPVVAPPQTPPPPSIAPPAAVVETPKPPVVEQVKTAPAVDPEEAMLNIMVEVHRVAPVTSRQKLRYAERPRI